MGEGKGILSQTSSSFPASTYGSSNTMGVRVTTGDLMYLCGSGLMPNDYAWNSRRLFEVQEALSTAAESHVVHYDDLEPHGAGGHIDGF